MRKKSIALTVISTELLKTLEKNTISIKHYLFLLLLISVTLIMKKIFKEEEPIKILKVLG